MIGMGWETWYTLAVLVAVVVMLVREISRPEIVLLGALGCFLAGGILSPEDTFSGFSNSAVLTVGALFVVAAGIQRTDALGFIDHFLVRGSGRLSSALFRSMVSTAFLSSVINNTPLVAMLSPRIQQMARSHGLSPSKLLIPLSYASIAGGLITLIGTSTTIVVSGLLEGYDHPPFHFFDITWIGVPIAGVVILFFLTVGHRLLPDGRAEGVMPDEGINDSLFEIRLAPGSVYAGKSIEEAGLRNLGDAYLGHMRRGDRLLSVDPNTVLQEGDVLSFVGNPDELDRLLGKAGLERVIAAVPGTNPNRTLPLYEAVIAEGSRLVGHTLREVEFREHYGGVVLAIRRKDKRINQSLGRTPLEAGDLLLVEAGNGFDKRWNTRRDIFYLIAPRRAPQKKKPARRAPVALGIFALMVLAVASDLVPLVTAVFSAALAMVVTRCLRGDEARQAIDLQVLVMIAAAIGISQAIDKTGLASVFAYGMVYLSGSTGLIGVLVLLYLMTNLLTELVTHKAAAIFMLPVALSLSSRLGINPLVLALVVTVAAAASFVTPNGYQTNLMVMTAGRYRFSDFVRVGLPVGFLVMTVTIVGVHWLGLV